MAEWRQRMPGATVAPFKVIERDGVEIMALNNRTLGGGDVIGVYTLIAERSNVIATAYLLNQKLFERGFKDYGQYQALRDDLVVAQRRVHGGVAASAAQPFPGARAANSVCPALHERAARARWGRG